MIFTDAPEVQQSLTLEDLPGSFSDAVAASANSALYNSPTSQLYRTWQDYSAEGPTLDYETARTRAKTAGVDLQIDPQGVNQGALDLLIARKRTQARTNDALARGPQGFAPGAAYFLTGLGASLLDPINIAASFIPVAGPIGLGSSVARAGALGAEGAALTLAGRTAARLRVGAAEGAVGQALVEPLTAYRATQEQEDYGITDTLLNIGFGTVLGAVAHGGLGALGDRAVAGQRATTAKALIDAAQTVPEAVAVKFRPDSAAAKLQGADMETVATTFRAAVAAELDGRKMNLETLVPEKAPEAPPTPIDVRAIMDANQTADGRLKGDEAAAAIVAQAQEALDSGKKVTLFADGKPVEITAIDGGMLADAQGQRWGTLALLTDAEGKRGNRVEISEQNTAQAPADTARAATENVAEKPDVDPMKVQEAAAASHLAESDVHYDAQAKTEVDQAITTQGADREAADIINESLMESQTELATLQKQMGVDPEKNAAMRVADETVATASKYTKAIEAYATCQVRT